MPLYSVSHLVLSTSSHQGTGRERRKKMGRRDELGKLTEEKEKENIYFQG